MLSCLAISAVAAATASAPVILNIASCSASTAVFTGLMAAPVALSRSPLVTVRLRSPGTVSAEVAVKAAGKIKRRSPLVSCRDALLPDPKSFTARPPEPLMLVFKRKGLAALATLPLPTCISMRSALKNSAVAVVPLLVWPLVSRPPPSSRVRVLPALRARPVVPSARGFRAATVPPLLNVWIVRLPPALAFTLMASLLDVLPPT